MYDALAREHMQMEQDLIRRRLEAAARLPRRWDLNAACTTAERQHWWARARRHTPASC